MKSKVSRAGSSKAAALPKSKKPSPAPAAKPAPAPRPVKSAKLVKHLPMMKALASQTRLAALELCLDGSAFTATALQKTMRLSARRIADHLRILCQVGVLQRQKGYDKRETEYFIRPGFVRKAENGTAIFDFGSGQLHFPRVRLRE